MNKRIIYVLILSIITVFGFIGCETTKPEDKTNEDGSRTITIKNNTDDVITGLFVKNPERADWGNSLIHSWNSIPVEGYRTVSIERNLLDNQQRADIQLRTSSGHLFTKTLHSIIHNGEVIFTSSDLDDRSPRTITILNNSDEVFNQVYIKNPDSLVWGNSLIHSWSPISHGNTGTFTIERILMNAQFRSDIQLRTSEGYRYTKTIQIIEHNGTVIFVNRDFDESGPRKITIINSTNEPINQVFIKSPESLDWGDSLIHSWSPIPIGSAQSFTIDDSVIDIRISNTSTGTTFTKWDFRASHREEINFTIADRDW